MRALAQSKQGEIIFNAVSPYMDNSFMKNSLERHWWAYDAVENYTKSKYINSDEPTEPTVIPEKNTSQNATSQGQ
jgi:hypothetical protein